MVMLRCANCYALHRTWRLRSGPSCGATCASRYGSPLNRHSRHHHGVVGPGQPATSPRCVGVRTRPVSATSPIK
jgi:hypothetical protein